MELNEKLARWAGFEPQVIVKDKVRHWYRWEDGKLGGYHNNLFNFTESLDACFKWLVPKVDSYTLLSDKRNEHQASVRKSGMHYHGEAETPALALCLAIEKLIGDEYE